MLYNNIEIGCEVNLRKRKGVSNGKHSQWRTPLLGNTIDNLMAIVGNKAELLKSNPKLIITDASNQELLDDNINDVTNYKPSGMLLLLLIKWDRDNVKSAYLWSDNEAVNIKKYKTNIITAHSSHFGSTGAYYLFGNREHYGLINNCSVAQFVPK